MSLEALSFTPPVALISACWAATSVCAPVAAVPGSMKKPFPWPVPPAFVSRVVTWVPLTLRERPQKPRTALFTAWLVSTLKTPVNSSGMISSLPRRTSVTFSMVWALMETSAPWIRPERFSRLPAAVTERMPPAWIVPSAFSTWPDELMVRPWLASRLPAFAISPVLRTSIWPEISPRCPLTSVLP